MRLIARLVAALIAAIPAAALADDEIGQSNCAHPGDLRFAPGATSTTVSGTISREQVGCYAFSARKGQTLDIAMTGDSTRNAAAIVFEPGWGLRKDEDFQYTDGKELPGAGRGDVASHVHAVLPVGGRYLIMTAPAYGGAAGYTMRVRIH